MGVYEEDISGCQTKETRTQKKWNKDNNNKGPLGIRGKCILIY